MKAWWRRVRPYVLDRLVYAIARGVGLTLRIRQAGPGYGLELPEGVGRVLAGWHGLTFVAASAYRNRGYWTIISTSRDGEMQHRIFTRFGFKTIRGSTGRGGVRAAVESIRVLRQGETMAFTPDGPRGPSMVVQPGVVTMAHKSGAAMIPVGVASNRAWAAPTWDRYQVPKPFARCLMWYGDPIFVAPHATPEELEAARLALEQAILAAQTEAERQIGARICYADKSRGRV